MGTNLIKNMKYIVYQTTNLINNKIYIGVHKTKDPNIFDGYIGNGIVISSPSSYMKPITPFQYAVKKYGVSNFKRTIIKIYDTLDEAFSLESEIVDYDFVKRKDTYNVALGGGGGNQSFIAINQFNAEGTLIKKWSSIIEASEFLGVYHTAICRAYKEKGSCKGFYWSTNEVIDISEYTYLKGTICYKYDSVSGKCIDIYNSIPEAAKENNVLESSIQRAIKAGYKVGEFYYSSKLLEEYNGKPKVSLKNKTLYIYSLNGDFVTELKNSKEICNFFKINTLGGVTTAIRAERPYKGYQLSLDKVQQLPKVVDKKNIKKRVGRYSLGGDLLEEFDSIEQAKLAWGSGAQKCAQGRQQQCKGYLFRIIS